MNKETLILLFILLFAFFSVPSTTAVPSSRSLKPLTLTETMSNQHLHNEFQMKGRMDMEIVADYSESGANNHHDPIPPGSS